mgnify:CR=1 FL=1
MSKGWHRESGRHRLAAKGIKTGRKKYEIFVGSRKAMQMIKRRGAMALNPRTHKWQVVDRTAEYKAEKDPSSAIGWRLMSDKNIRKIAEEKGLIL